MYVEVILGKGVGKGASVLTYFSSLPLTPGSIVEVPLMRTKAPGVVIKEVAQPDFKCREVSRVLYSKPLPLHLVKTAEWISKYYSAPLSGVMQMILPNGILKKRRAEHTTLDGSCRQSFPHCARLAPARSGRPPSSVTRPCRRTSASSGATNSGENRARGE